MEKKTVRDIMVKDVSFVSPETKISEVADILFRNRYHGVPVVENGKVIGIITESDFFIKNSSDFYLPSYINFLKESRVIDNLSSEKKAEMERLFNTRAKDIMTEKCVTVFEGMKIGDLFNFFKETNFATLPVVDEEEKLVGIVTLMDVIHLISQ